MKINEILPQESKFTEVLKTLAVIPKKLYYCGKLPENEAGSRFDGILGVTLKGACPRENAQNSQNGSPFPAAAIVGSRKNTAYGEEVAYKAAYECAKAGIIVVSGLAYGIDSIAHRGALDAGGITVAVLGTPIDQIYPRRHTGLAREIVDSGGAIISEYGPGERAKSGTEARTRFLARNRLISGLSQAVLIAEAADRSGTLNTAMHALDQGKDLFVAPGDIGRDSHKGCNQLLKQGAIPYLSPMDLIEDVLPEVALKKSSEVSMEAKMRRILAMAESKMEMAVLTEMLKGVNDGEEIIRVLSISPTEFARTVTLLEIKGVVKALGANRWMVRG